MSDKERTPAQKHIDHLYELGFDLGTHAVAVLNRVEEIASTVAALQEELSDWTQLVHARLNTHSQMISKAGTDCDICEGRGWSINVPSQTMYPCSWCKGKGKVSIHGEFAKLNFPEEAGAE